MMKIATYLGVFACAAQLHADPVHYIKDTLDSCLENRNHVEAIYKDRFPHDTCRLETCPQDLVLSAEILATNQCRTAAMQACLDTEDAAPCLVHLQRRWLTQSLEARDSAQSLWDQLDPALVPPILRQRLETPSTWTFLSPCAEGDNLPMQTCNAEDIKHDLERFERLELRLKRAKAP